jgi:periplasmic copper chaperone A
VSCSLLLATSGTALAAPTGALSVSHAWARATPPGVAVGGAYFTIVNGSKQSDTLVSLSTPAAAKAELHRTSVENGVSRMRPAGQIVIAPGRTVKAEPGGLHVMLTGLMNPLTPGMRVPLVLTFRQAGAIPVLVEIQSISSAAHEGTTGH